MGCSEAKIQHCGYFCLPLFKNLSCSKLKSKYKRNVYPSELHVSRGKRRVLWKREFLYRVTAVLWLVESSHSLQFFSVSSNTSIVHATVQHFKGKKGLNPEQRQGTICLCVKKSPLLPQVFSFILHSFSHPQLRGRGGTVDRKQAGSCRG